LRREVSQPAQKVVQGVALEEQRLQFRCYAEEVARRAQNPMDRAHGWGGLFREWVADQTGGNDTVQELEAINTELADSG
jgi:hypothetical protein